MDSTYLKIVTKLKYAKDVLLIVVLIAMVYGWYNRSDLAGLFVTIPPPEIRTETVEIERIVYLNRPELADRGLLPERVRVDTSKEVTAAVVVPSHDAGTTVVAVIDKGTGETTLDVRQERPSLFGLENIKAIGIRCDIANKCNELTLYGSYTFLRIGSFHTDLYAEINEDKAYAGIGLEYGF